MADPLDDRLARIARATDDLAPPGRLAQRLSAAAAARRSPALSIGIAGAGRRAIAMSLIAAAASIAMALHLEGRALEAGAARALGGASP